MLVSVVIPSYNHRRYVVQAIESVLDQSWPQVDLIVIDDGSKDGSPEVIQKLRDERGGFRFFARENRGLIKTLNEGLSLARGEFICELASDDYLPNDSLEKRVSFLIERPEYVAVYGDGTIIKNDVSVEGTLLTEKMRRALSRSNPISDMLAGARPVFSTGLFRRSALLAIGGFDDQTFRYYEDLDTPILLALQGKQGLIESPVICRRQHETNVSSSTNHVRAEKVLCYRKFYSHPAFRPYRTQVGGLLRREYLKLGRYLAGSRCGTSAEREIFLNGGRFALSDPRIIWYQLIVRLFKPFSRIK